MFARGALFTAAAIALLAGLILPGKVMALDILWVFILSVTAAILLISLLAKNIAELKGFELLVAAATLLRMAANINSAKLIFRQGQGGIIIETFGKVVCASGKLWIASISLPITAAAAILIFAAAKRIANLSDNFGSEIMPIKQAGIETDLAGGLITAEDAARLNESVNKEGLFYLNISDIARLFRLDAVVAAVMVSVLIVLQTLFSSMDISGPAAIQNAADAVGGAAALALTPGIIIAMASAYLLAKTSQSVAAEEKKDRAPPRKTIEVITTDTGETEEVELLNPEFADRDDTSEAAAQRTENIANFEPLASQQEISRDESNIIPVGHKFKNIEDYYDDIAEHITELSSEEMPVLLAAENINELPVTVAVNVAVRISRTSGKTLLIDADPARNAVSKAFDIPTEKITDDGTDTCIDNLSVWTDDAFKTIDVEKLDDKMARLKNRYEKIIIYAPNLTSPLHAVTLTKIAKRGVVFSLEDIDRSKVYQLLLVSPCKPVAVMLSPEKAV